MRAALLFILCAACPGKPRSESTSRPTVSWQSARYVTQAVTAPDDGQWLMASKDYASTRFSGLTEITTANVGQLKLAWTFETGLTGGHEAAPLVVGDTLYVTTPFPNRLLAFDLTRPPLLRFTYAPPVRPAARGVACCDVVNRGAVYADGVVYFATLDGQLAAVDAGKPPLHLGGTPHAEDNVGLLVSAEGKTVAYFPCVGGEPGPEVHEALDRADIVFFDGTFWQDDEPTCLVPGASARTMAHWPLCESLPWLSGLGASVRRLIHVNNTNPAQAIGSPAHDAVARARFTLAEDGEELRA